MIPADRNHVHQLVGWNMTETAARLGCEHVTLWRLLNGKAGCRRIWRWRLRISVGGLLITGCVRRRAAKLRGQRGNRMAAETRTRMPHA